ncbi:MAG: type II toxin-antitoxin system PemK/MazF family toxin [Candidatus Taylorbacteria bacterium]|nr:type II toxin-antitoxin system PemK/MazF family toxin [Candidatus Taylorbacteria bacterium]
MIHDFYLWMERKEKIHLSDSAPRFVHEKEIWWCSVGQNIGFETNGKGFDFCRPVLVIKKMSKHTFIGVPLTTKPKNGSWYVGFKHKEKDIVADISQLRMFDCKRLLKKIGETRDTEYVLVKKGIGCLLDI